MTKVIQAKQGNFQALCYNSWAPVDFPVLAVSAVPAYKPLGLNYKFTHLAYIIPASITPGLIYSVNAISGLVTAAPTHNTSYGYFNIGGTFNSSFRGNDEIYLTIAGVKYTFNVTSRYDTLAKIMAAFANDLNQNPVFNVGYIANSLNAEMVIQPLTYAAVTPSYSVAVSSANGTATAGGSTFVAGTGGGSLPTQPVSDETYYPGAPSPTAVAGNALFPVDIILPTFSSAAEGQVGTIFATANFDAIWPINSAMSLTLGTDGSTGTGGLIAVLYGVPVDNHRFLPATLPKGFQINSEIL